MTDDTPTPDLFAAGDHTMIRTALVAALAAGLFAAGWGCNPSPGGQASGPTPAARLARLEAELQSVRADQAKMAEESAAAAAALRAERQKAAELAAERDRLQQGLTARQAELAAKQAELAAKQAERDELRKGLDERQAERDAARARLDGFRRELQGLLEKAGR
jgi:chromosome segregation ATPase